MLRMVGGGVAIALCSVLLSEFCIYFCMGVDVIISIPHKLLRLDKTFL